MQALYAISVRQARLLPPVSFQIPTHDGHPCLRKNASRHQGVLGTVTRQNMPMLGVLQKRLCSFITQPLSYFNLDIWFRKFLLRQEGRRVSNFLRKEFLSHQTISEKRKINKDNNVRLPEFIKDVFIDLQKIILQKATPLLTKIHFLVYWKLWGRSWKNEEERGGIDKYWYRNSCYQNRNN